MKGSVRLTVCLPVCQTVCLSHLFNYVQELLPMSEVMSMQKVKVRGQNPT